MKKTVLILTLLCIGCKSKQVEQTKAKQELSAQVEQSTASTEQAQNTTTIQANESEVKELITLLQSFQIGYDGQELNDKLDFLLKRTEKGTQITISGKGTANLVESRKSNVESLKKDLYKWQDSLHRAELAVLQSLKAEIYKLQKNKEKEVTAKSFLFSAWLVITFVILLVLRWIAKRFKL